MSTNPKKIIQLQPHGIYTATTISFSQARLFVCHDETYFEDHFSGRGHVDS